MFIISSTIYSIPGKDNAEGFDTSVSIDERLLCRWLSRRSKRNWHPTSIGVHRRMTALQLALCWWHRSAGRQRRRTPQQLTERPEKTPLVTAWRSAPTKAKFPPISPSQDHLPTLEELDHFKYLGSTQTEDGTPVKEVKTRLAQAILWESTSIRFPTKIKLHKSLVLSTLLY